MTDVDPYLTAVDRAVAAGRTFAGTATRPPGSLDGPRVTAAYKLVFLHRGHAVVELDRRPRRLHGGDVALVRPGHRERMRFAPDVESEQSWLVLQRPPLAPAELAALDAAPFSLPISASMLGLLRAALALYGRLTVPGPALVLIVCAALNLYLEEAHEHGRRGAPAEGADAADAGAGGWPREHVAVTAARATMQRRLREPISLRDVADDVHVAPAHLVRLFRRYTGGTPFAYLWHERRRVGLHLLEHTGLSVGDVAEQSGFRSTAHFSRVMRATTGLSPLELRRRSGTAPAD